MPHSRICVPLFRYVILKRLVSLGRSKSGFAAVFRHHLRLQLLRAWRRPCNGACRHIDDGRAGKDLTFGGLIVFRDCGDDWNINHQHGGFDGFRRSGRIDDNACRALHFGHHGQFGHTWTCGGATAHAYEQRHLGYGEQRLRDDRLAGERVDGENGVE